MSLLKCFGKKGFISLFEGSLFSIKKQTWKVYAIAVQILMKGLSVNLKTK